MMETAAAQIGIAELPRVLRGLEDQGISVDDEAILQVFEDNMIMLASEHKGELKA